MNINNERERERERESERVIGVKKLKVTFELEVDYS